MYVCIYMYIYIYIYVYIAGGVEVDVLDAERAVDGLLFLLCSLLSLL